MSEAGDYRRLDVNNSACLVSMAFESAFAEGWLWPEFWQQAATPVTQGGRGAAWFIDADAGQFVLRHFCRGGLPGRLVRHSYLFLGADKVRAFAEFRLLLTLQAMGLPVPEPVAAGYRRVGVLFYRAGLLIRRIPGAQTLVNFNCTECLPVWHKAGACIRRFHDQQVYHADLNCTNILVADQIYLIDFDKGRIMEPGEGEKWKMRNLSRLRRSVDKCLARTPLDLRESLWKALLDGYQHQPQQQ